jgi:hypothetical protein
MDVSCHIHHENLKLTLSRTFSYFFLLLLLTVLSFPNIQKLSLSYLTLIFLYINFYTLEFNFLFISLFYDLHFEITIYFKLLIYFYNYLQLLTLIVELISWNWQLDFLINFVFTITYFHNINVLSYIFSVSFRFIKSDKEDKDVPRVIL